MGKLIKRIPGSRLLIPGMASKMHVETRSSFKFRECMHAESRSQLRERSLNREVLCYLVSRTHSGSRGCVISSLPGTASRTHVES